MTRSTARGLVPENSEKAPTPTDKTILDGQKADHWVLPEEERAKGFVRPVRHAYQHVGIAAPKFPLRDLTEEEKERFNKFGYVKYETYPPSAESSVVGRFWRQSELDKIGKGCGVVTTMGNSIAETYARNPHYYGSTWCCGCRNYIAVGEMGEFVWDGTNERVGT